MNADTIWLLHKQVHDKRGIAESLHARITKTRLTACEVAIFSREISQLLKVCPPPLLLGATEVHRPWAYFREITVLKIECCWLQQ